MRHGTSIGSDAAAAITRVDVGQDVDLQRLLGEARGLQAYQGSDTRTIAVLGDSGEGTILRF